MMVNMTEKNIIVYFDIDGTLFDSARGVKIPPSAIDALCQLKRNGILTALNTGRTTGMIPKFIFDLGFDAVIAGCGTCVSLGSQILVNEVFDRRRTKKVLAAFRAERLDVLLEGPYYGYFEEDSFDPEVVGRSAHLFDDLTTLRPLSGADPQISKVSYLVYDEEKDQRLRAALKDELHFIVHSNALREGIPHGFCKAGGMKVLEDALGRPYVSYAIGDSINDIPMLTKADVGIVMGNGQDEAKAAATFVTRPLEDDGIRHALCHYNLIN
jgi:Cof subfamily protein (haloacid dehalogenase superfamily)